jgi:hypothetical protein
VVRIGDRIPVVLLDRSAPQRKQNAANENGERDERRPTRDAAAAGARDYYEELCN